ncbi:hypothetical protein FQN54_003700 [Arachnomyces sp. PD_36]|nr:hypothetical protein FQN54_003700 [Arachnomyces sp. PD_36]
MSVPEKDASGAHVTNPPPPTINIPDPYSTEGRSLLTSSQGGLSPTRTAQSLSPTTPAEEEFDPSLDAKPYSPFYRHPTTRTSLEQLKSETKFGRGCSQDLEAGTRIRMSGDMAANCHRLSGWNQKKPTKHRALNCLRGLTKGQRLAVKLIIAVVVVGGMVGIGLGISKAVGGGFWKSEGQASDIE